MWGRYGNIPDQDEDAPRALGQITGPRFTEVGEPLGLRRMERCCPRAFVLRVKLRSSRRYPRYYVVASRARCHPILFQSYPHTRFSLSERTGGFRSHRVFGCHPASGSTGFIRPRAGHVAVVGRPRLEEDPPERLPANSECVSLSIITSRIIRET